MEDFLSNEMAANKFSFQVKFHIKKIRGNVTVKKPVWNRKWRYDTTQIMLNALGLLKFTIQHKSNLLKGIKMMQIE
jgi:hypothetical protein